MNEYLESQTEVLSVLVSNDRKELGKIFGVGLYVTDDETAEQVKAKCERYIARYSDYIANLKAILEIPDNNLKSEMRKAKALRYIESLSKEDKEALKELI